MGDRQRRPDLTQVACNVIGIGVVWFQHRLQLTIWCDRVPSVSMTSRLTLLVFSGRLATTNIGDGVKKLFIRRQLVLVVGGGPSGNGWRNAACHNGKYSRCMDHVINMWCCSSRFWIFHYRYSSRPLPLPTADTTPPPIPPPRRLTPHCHTATRTLPPATPTTTLPHLYRAYYYHPQPPPPGGLRCLKLTLTVTWPLLWRGIRGGRGRRMRETCALVLHHRKHARWRRIPT